MKKTFLLILLIPSIFFGQDVNNLQSKKLNDLNDSELIDYWTEAKKSGSTINELKNLARAQGISESEIIKIEQRIKLLNLNTDEELLDQFESSSMTSIFGKTDEDENNTSVLNVETEKLPIFGSNFFNNENISPAPQLNIATPNSYELGPGDEILISIWGAAENEYLSKISTEGFVKVERIGPVYISGLTISEAKNKLLKSLSKIYSGLTFSNNSIYKVYIDLSLTKSRSIVVNVTGNVIAPDTYTISSLASVLNVLYAAGGPDESGSYRNIKVIRGGKEIRNIDLYDYFSSGQLETFSLRDQDVINVPNYENRVFVNGEFKTTGVFELKENENIIDLMGFNGGISSFGYKEKLFVKRTDGYKRKIENVIIQNFKDFKLKDGDIIEARPVTDSYTNRVTIEGAIAAPGEYSTSNIQTVDELISQAGGFQDYAVKERVYILRKSNGIVSEIVSIDMSNSSDTPIKADDTVIVSSSIDLNRTENVTIQGEVFSPDKYPYYEGMTLIDLILISKGLTTKGDLNNIKVYRPTYDETRKNPVETFNVSLNTDLTNLDDLNNMKLKKNDLVVIRKKLGYQDSEVVEVEGLVKNPGIYVIRNNNYSFFDLMNDFGGFLNDASINGVKISREIKISESESKIDDDLITNISSFIEIGVDVENILKTEGSNSKYNIILKNGDKITVPRIDNTIEVAGAVQQPSALTYSKNLKTLKAIYRSGGFTVNAKKNKVYVVYQNGNILSTKNFLFFKNYPKLKPGAKIIVPEKSKDKVKTSIGEIVGYTTSLVSIIALIKSL